MTGFRVRYLSIVLICGFCLGGIVGVTAAAPPDPEFSGGSSYYWVRSPSGTVIEFGIRIGSINNGGAGNVFYKLYKQTVDGEHLYSSKVFWAGAGKRANITTHFSREPSGYTLIYHEIRPAQPGDTDYGDVTIFYPDAPPSVTLTSFNNGGTVYTSHRYRISWRFTGDPGSTLRLDLVNGSGSSIIASGVDTGDDGSGSYVWEIPAGIAPESNYRIRITSAKSLTDTSDTAFTIKKPSITLTSPNGGEVLERGRNNTISWTYVNEDTARVRIDLYKDGALVRTLSASAPIGSGGTGSYQWMTDVSDAVGTNYSIHLSSSGATDESDSAFAISNPAQLAVHSPNGGEVWYTGDQYTIEWFYPDSLSGSPVTVSLLKPGTPDRIICENDWVYPDGHGFYSWDVPGDIPAGHDYTIRVSLGAGSTDTSNAVFTIRDPFISVKAPTAGGVWEPGSQHDITWEYGGIAASETVRIDLLKSGDLSRNIHTGYPIPMNRYFWSIPPDQAPGNDYTIRLTSSSGHSGSSGIFTIGVPPMEADFTGLPTSGAAPLTVSFTDRSTGSPTSWRWLFGDNSAVNATRRNPVHTYTRPGNFSVSLNVSGASESDTVTKSRYIRVTSPIRVVVPDGGESWTQGSNRTIRWNYTGTPGPGVRIELLKGATVNRVISAGTPIGSHGSGAFRWTIPFNQAPGTGYRIRINTTGIPAYTDTSNANFTIRTGAPFTVTSPNGGQTWKRGSVRAISWAYTGSPGPFVRIELLKGGIFNRVISANTSVGSGGSGTKNWSIPSLQAPGTDYRVRVTSLKNRLLNDSSNADFAISA